MPRHILKKKKKKKNPIVMGQMLSISKPWEKILIFLTKIQRLLFGSHEMLTGGVSWN